MANGNNYPAWLISNENELFTLNPDGSTTSRSEKGFAKDVGIAEDGTVWVLANEPDPDGGGGKIFWGSGDGNWTEVQTKDPGGAKISGYTGSKCIYLTNDGFVISMDTNNQSAVVFELSEAFDFDYGGGFFWGIFSDKEGEKPILHLAKEGGQWTEFQGDVTPTSLSVNYNGDCYAVLDNDPMGFESDGKTSFNDGDTNSDGKTLQITFKNTYYLLSTNCTEQGNEVMVWEDVDGGTWKSTGAFAAKVISTWYKPS